MLGSDRDHSTPATEVLHQNIGAHGHRTRSPVDVRAYLIPGKGSRDKKPQNEVVGPVRHGKIKRYRDLICGMLAVMAVYTQPAFVRKRLHVQGIVQGVGFRPFVYNLARKFALNGYVLNSSSGVEIEIEGSPSALEAFLNQLHGSPPPLSRVEKISSTDLGPCGYTNFSIRESVNEEGQFGLVPPDVGTCADCWEDAGDPENRRFGYPFTNCTNCGPRYTIIQDLPYDRPATTMAPFQMCALCKSEYENPGDRRFHAQPNACTQCGPTLSLVQNDFFPLPHKQPTVFESSAMSVQKARQLLREGNIIAVKGLGGFLLACDAQNNVAVQNLRLRKRRSDKPFALMARDIESIKRFCFVSDDDRQALLSAGRPIVILPRRCEANLSLALALGTRRWESCCPTRRCTT